VSEPGEPIEFHLLLDADEAAAAAQALRLYISDEAHHPEIRMLAREVLAAVTEEGAADAGQGGARSVALTGPEMKVAYSAVRLLLGDLQREQSQERELLHAILAKLPDEHVMNAIRL
jgi:hypothetical protein